VGAIQLPIPTGTYADQDVRASAKRLINCFAEQVPQEIPANAPLVGDSKQKAPAVVLRRAPGIDAFATDGTPNPVRGAWMMGGIEYVVIGANLYTLSTIGSLGLVGTGIVGGSFVRITDNGCCLVILNPGTGAAYTYTVSTGLLQLPLPYPAMDCWFMDSYVIFLQTSGRGFFNDDGQIVSGTGPITFGYGNVFPREFGTDLFVGMCIANRNIYCFGQRTSEIYMDTGSSVTVGTPFTDAPNGFIQMGMLPGAQYSAVLQANGIYWLAQDRAIYSMNGVTPVRVSNHGIEGILATLDVTGSYGFAYSLGGHRFVAWTFPAATAGRTLVLDVTTGEWHEMQSFGLGYWRPLCCHNVFGKYLVGDSQSGKLGMFDTSTLTEWGVVRTSTWTHQAVYNQNNRLSHRRLELVLGGGFAPFTGAPQDVNPLITLKVSDDGGVTYRTLPDRSLGTTGNYMQRMVWFNLGMSRQRVYQFELSANAESWVTDLIADIEGGHW
jgi:hypothetical protein